MIESKPPKKTFGPILKNPIRTDPNSSSQSTTFESKKNAISYCENKS